MLKYENRNYDNCPDVSEERWTEIQKKFPHFPRLRDISANRREAFIRLPKSIEDTLVKTFLQDPRDAIMISVTLNIILTVGPLTALLWYRPFHLLGFCLAFLKTFMWLQRFMLMMHYSEHRRLFKDPYHSVGKHMMNFFMSPFMGLAPGAYRLHHVIMHHVENNYFEQDLSSTEPY